MATFKQMSHRWDTAGDDVESAEQVPMQGTLLTPPHAVLSLNSTFDDSPFLFSDPPLIKGNMDENRSANVTMAVESVSAVTAGDIAAAFNKAFAEAGEWIECNVSRSITTVMFTSLMNLTLILSGSRSCNTAYLAVYSWYSSY